MGRNEGPSPLEIATIELGAAAKIVAMLKERMRHFQLDTRDTEGDRAYENAVESIIRDIEEEKWR